MSREALKAGINRVLDDGGPGDISRRTLAVYGRGDWPMISGALQEWEAAGYLDVLGSPEHAENTDICVHMHRYIERRGPKGNPWSVDTDRA